MLGFEGTSSQSHLVSGSIMPTNDFTNQQEAFFGKKNKQGGQIVTNASSKPLKEFEEDEFADF